MSAPEGVPPARAILAAGASRRLGTPKALVRLRETDPGTPLACLIAAAANAAAGPLLVIGGAEREALAAALSRARPAGPPGGVELGWNAEWERGRTGSAALAARLRPGRDLCLAPVDVPLVGAAVFAALDAAWARAGAPPRGWLAPYVEEDGGERRFGHPVVLGRDLAAELPSLPAERPLRELRARAEPLLAVRVDDPAILDDLDGPRDLERLRARLAPRNRPPERRGPTPEAPSR